MGCVNVSLSRAQYCSYDDDLGERKKSFNQKKMNDLKFWSFPRKIISAVFFYFAKKETWFCTFAKREELFAQLAKNEKKKRLSKMFHFLAKSIEILQLKNVRHRPENCYLDFETFFLLLFLRQRNVRFPFHSNRQNFATFQTNINKVKKKVKICAEVGTLFVKQICSNWTYTVEHIIRYLILTKSQLRLSWYCEDSHWMPNNQPKVSQKISLKNTYFNTTFHQNFHIKNNGY